MCQLCVVCVDHIPMRVFALTVALLICPLPAAGKTILKKCRRQSSSDQAIFLRRQMQQWCKTYFSNNNARCYLLIKSSATLLKGLLEVNNGVGPIVQDLVRLFQKSPQGVQLLLRRIGLVSILMERLTESGGDPRWKGSTMCLGNV